MQDHQNTEGKQKRAYQVAMNIFVIIAMFAFASLGLGKIQFNSHYSAYFDPKDENVQLAQYFNKTYQTNDSLIIALKDEPQNVLSKQRIIEYSQLQNALEQLPFVVEIHSFYQDLLLEPWLEEQEALEYLLDNYPTQAERLAVVKDNKLTQRLLSDNNRLGLIEIVTEVPKGDSKAMLAFSTMLDEEITPLIATWQNSPSLYYSGTMALNKTYFDVVRHDIKIFIPCLLLVFFIGLFYLFRSFAITSALMAIGFASVYVSLGILCWFAIELTAINAFTPVIIITLSIATNAHLVMTYLRGRADGLAIKQAVNESLSTNQKPYCLSLITTGLGFLMLATSPSPPIQVVGYSVALAMMINLYLGLNILPKLLSRISIAPKHLNSPATWFGRQRSEKLTATILFVLKNYHKPTIFITFAILALAVLGFKQFKINDDVYQYFPKEHNFSQGIKVIEQEFSGISPLQFELALQQGTVFNEQYLRLIKQFSVWALKQETIAEVISPVLDIPSSEVLNSLEQKIIDSPIEQVNINKWLRKDLKATKLIVLLKKQDAVSIIETNQAIKVWFDNNAPINHQLVGGSGPDLIFAKLGQRNASSMLYSLIAALIVISLLIGAIEKSLKITLISLACNLFPIIVVYGMWSFFGGYISLGVALVMGMVMGIIVDDTLHIILKRHAYQQTATLLNKVSPTIIMTSVIIISGLAIGLTSDFTPIRELSVLTMFCIVLALFADLLLLPQLLEKWSK